MLECFMYILGTCICANYLLEGYYRYISPEIEFVMGKIKNLPEAVGLSD